jgi:hypothetical protein
MLCVRAPCRDEAQGSQMSAVYLLTVLTTQNGLDVACPPKINSGNQEQLISLGGV